MTNYYVSILLKVTEKIEYPVAEKILNLTPYIFYNIHITFL
jgi:hypothetical protein